jgi:hypothetical protein
MTSTFCDLSSDLLIRVVTFYLLLVLGISIFLYYSLLFSHFFCFQDLLFLDLEISLYLLRLLPSYCGGLTSLFLYSFHVGRACFIRYIRLHNLPG